MADLSTIERFYKVTVDATQAITQLNKFAKGTEESTEKLAKMAETAIEWGKHIAEAYVLDKVVEQFMHVVEALDDTAKAAQRVGVAADQLQQLRYAATASGSSAEQMDHALEKLSVNMLEVA